MSLLQKMRLVYRCFLGDAREKYEARHSALSAVAKRCSLRVYNKNLSWIHDDEYIGMWGGFPESSKEVAERKFNLYYLAKSTSDVPGDTAECGVYRGASSYIILKAHEGRGKSHHIFDSFEGLSEPTTDDAVRFDRTFIWKKHDLSIPEDVVRRNLQQFDGVQLYKGWIPERFADVAEKQFSFVHIDVDLYDPTYDSVAFFYERLAPGGMIVCDDYGFDSCPGAYKSMNDFMADKPEQVIHLTTGQGLVIKR